MDVETRFPVLRREMRLALPHGGSWRSSWKAMAIALFGTLFLLWIGRYRGMMGVHLLQFIGALSATVVAWMPLGFVRDRDAGQQSLLRLTGLGPLRVFAESSAGSLWAAAQIGLYVVPIVLAGSCLHRLPFHRAVLVALIPGLLVVVIASVWILAVAVSRTRTGAGLFAGLLAVAILAPGGIHLLAGAHLPPGLRDTLGVVWGAESFSHLGDVFRPRAPLAPFVSILVRAATLAAVLLAVAAACYCRDWERAEAQPIGHPPRRLRLPFLPDAAPRRPVEGNPYLRRYPAADGWRRIRWLLAVLVLGVGVAGAVAWSWTALPVVLTLWVTVLDLAAHGVVSDVVAQDRRAGALELLFTTALPPRDLLEAGNQVGRGRVRDGLLPGLVLAVAFVVLALGMSGSDHLTDPSEAVTLLGFWGLPVTYGAALYHLPFRLPASQSANTGEPWHSFSMPLTAFVMPLMAGGVAWVYSMGSPGVRLGVVLSALAVQIVVLIARESFASDKPLDDEELRTVAAAPLPTPAVIPKDPRTTRPWIPEGFRR